MLFMLQTFDSLWCPSLYTVCAGKTSDVNAWSSLLPCKAGPAVGACYPPSGPGLVVVSPAVVGAGGATDTANHGNGYSGSKRGATARGMGGGGSELFLSRVCRHGFCVICLSV